MNNFKKTKYLHICLFSIFWIIFWLSINTVPKEIYLFGVDFIKSINSFRLVTALFLSIILLILFLFNLNKNQVIKNNLKKNYLSNLFLILFLTYLVSLIFNNERDINLDNTYLVILSFGSIILFYLINTNKDELLKYFIIINIFFLVIIIFVIIYPKFNELTLNQFNFYLTFAKKDGNILNQVNPRITGISRSLAILTIFLVLLFLNQKNKIIKILLFFAFMIFNFIIITMESRGTILCFYISIFSITIFMNSMKFSLKLIMICVIIFLNFIFIQFNVNKINTSNETINTDIKSNVYQSRLFKSNSSGRVDIWSYTINNYNYKNFFGYGSQGDRFFLEKYENKKDYGDNSSNAILYSLLSGGYLGLILIILIYINLTKKIFLGMSFNKKDDIYYNFSISVIIFFFIRSLFENSFALFSIDYLLILTSIFYIQSVEMVKKN